MKKYYQIITCMNENVLDNLVQNLQMLRKKKGYSCKLLSELIGCDSSYISKIENKRIIPSLDKVIAIANYFEINFTELFCNSDVLK